MFWIEGVLNYKESILKTDIYLYYLKNKIKDVSAARENKITELLFLSVGLNLSFFGPLSVQDSCLEKVYFDSLNYRPSMIHILQPQNRVYRLLQLSKPVQTMPLGGFG